MPSARTLRSLLLVGIGSLLPLPTATLHAAPGQIADARDDDRQNSNHNRTEPSQQSPQPKAQPPPRSTPPPAPRSAPPGWQGTAPRMEPQNRQPQPGQAGQQRQYQPPAPQPPSRERPPAASQPSPRYRSPWETNHDRTPPPSRQPAPPTRPTPPGQDHDRRDGGDHRFHPPGDGRRDRTPPPPANRDTDWRRDRDHDQRPVTDRDRDRRPGGDDDRRDRWRDWSRRHDRDDWRFYPHPRYAGWIYWDPYGFDDPFWGGYTFWNGAYYYSWYEYPPTTYIVQQPSSATYEVEDSEPAAPAALPPGPALYFPPSPPPLGSPLPPSLDTSAQPAPAELGLWIGESFYAPLAYRIAAGALPASVRARLDGYRSEKGAALAALRARLASTESLSPEARRRALEAFAREQAPALRTLDERAEELRRILVQGGDGLTRDNPWYDLRSWRLGPESAQLDPDVRRRLEFQAVRAAAYYEDGFPPTFRRLLRESSMELQMAALADRPDSPPPQGTPERVIFFSPSTSRLILPANLPAELASKFDAYDSEKRAVRSEIVTAVTQTDGLDPQGRADANAELVQRLAPRLIALESLANDIRSLVTETPGLFGPDRSITLPPDVANQLRSVLADRRQIRDAVYGEFQRLSSLVAPAALRMLPPDGPQAPALSVALTPHLGQSENRIAAMKEELASFNRTWASRITGLEQRTTALRSRIAGEFPSYPGAPQGVSPDAAFEICAAQIREEVAWQHYGDYRTALFEPGLSRAQRRLLYDAALASMSLPLPEPDRAWAGSP